MRNKEFCLRGLTVIIVPGDFTLSGNIVNFPPFSLIGERQCLQFETVKDIIVEDDERMTFQASTQNPLDVFISSTLSVLILDDDGKCS